VTDPIAEPEPSTLRQILRELPRRKVVLVLLVVVVNVGVVTCLWGRRIAAIRVWNATARVSELGGDAIRPARCHVQTALEMDRRQWRETFPWK